MIEDNAFSKRVEEGGKEIKENKKRIGKTRLGGLRDVNIVLSSCRLQDFSWTHARQVNFSSKKISIHSESV